MQKIVHIHTLLTIITHPVLRSNIKLRMQINASPSPELPTNLEEPPSKTDQIQSNRISVRIPKTLMDQNM